MKINLKNYFIQQADLLDCESSGANLTKHPTDTGDNREFLIKRFFDEHLPFRSRAFIGGKIFDSSNEEESSQVDLIIYNEFTPRFHHLNKTLYMAEGVYAAIEVKSMLTKTVINGSKGKKSLFDYCSSVKRLSKKFSSGGFYDSKGAPLEKIYFGIFAYKSNLNPQEIINETNHYYELNNMGKEFKIDFICVNKKFTIIFNKVNEAGWAVKKTKEKNKYVISEEGDLALWEMFLLILKQTNQLGLIPDYSAYMDK